MAVDPYAPCPCGSGSKLKFCCADLLHDLDKIHRMLDGDQPRAALSHVTATLRKAPGRGSLLDMKAMLEMSLDERENARATIEEFKRADPTNPAAYAQAAILAASEGGGVAGVAALQDALERLEDEMPSRVLQAVGAVGQALLIDANLVAARAHLWLYQGIAGRDDSRAMDLLMRLNQSAGLPLLLRDSLFLREAPADHPAAAAHDQAQLLASRGQWRRAAHALDDLCAAHPDLATLHHNRALVYGWLGDTERFVAGLRDFAGHAGAGGVALDDAIEAEAIAQLLDNQTREPAVEVVRATYAVADEEQLIDRLTRDGRTSAYQLDPSELAAIDGPPPRGSYLLLDREMPASGADVTADSAPRILGALAHYGRRTDRAERLELVVDRDDRYDATRALVGEIVGQALGEASDEEALGESPAAEPVFNWRLHFPSDTPLATRRSVHRDLRQKAVLEDWPERGRAALGGKTPAEVGQTIASDDAARVKLAAAVLVLEQSARTDGEAELFAQVRERVGLPAEEPIDPRAADFHTLPLCRLRRVDLAATSDDDLALLYDRATLAGANDAILRVARAAVDRPSLSEALRTEDLYYRIVSLEPDEAEALRWLNRARDAAEEAGKSSAPWDILELELAVVNSRIDEANRLVEHIRSDHLDEPGVAEQLYQMLYALGAVPAPGEEAPPAAGEMPPEAELAATPAAGSQASKIWTPGADSPAGAAPGGGGASKIWTPD